MSMRIHVNHYCLNMALCRWPSCHSVQSCSHDGKHVITHCSIFLGIPWIHSWVRCLSHQYWQDEFCVPCFWHSPQGSSLGLQRSDKEAGQAMSIKQEMSLPGNIGLRIYMEMCAVQAVASNSIVHDNSMEALLSEKAGFHISKAVTCFWHTGPSTYWSCNTRLFPLGVH